MDKQQLVDDLAGVVRLMQDELDDAYATIDRLKADVKRAERHRDGWHDAWTSDTRALQFEVERLWEGIAQHSDEVRRTQAMNAKTGGRARAKADGLLWSLIEDEDNGDG